MKDISNRFADSEHEPERKLEARSDPLARLQDEVPEPEEVERQSALRRWLVYLSGRADLLATIAAAGASALVLWPHFHPQAVHLPAIAETGDEMATLTVHPLAENGVATSPDWYTLFNAYQLETSLRDISIRCNYGLPVDARVDRYIHARLDVGSTIRVFLADPGTCPKL
jgi:hypothetical protein